MHELSCYTIVTVKEDNRQVKVAVQSPRGTRKEYKIRTEGLLSQSTLQKLREGKGVAWENLEKLCELLECQPADLVEFTADQKQE